MMFSYGKVVLVLCFFMAMAPRAILAKTIRSFTSEYFADWGESTCVQASSTNPPQPWDEMYGSKRECCWKLFWWNEECEFTESSTEPSTITSSKPVIEPLTSSSKKKTTFTPVDDVFVDDARPGKNFGDRNFLHIRSPKRRGHRESLLKFDLSTIDGKCIREASLELYSLMDASNGGSITTLAENGNLFARANQWKEGSATWRSMQASMEKRVVVFRTFNRVREREWVSIDVTRVVQNQDSPGVTFRLVSEGPPAKYASKERSQHAPKLTITLC